MRACKRRRFLPGPFIDRPNIRFLHTSIDMRRQATRLVTTAASSQNTARATAYTSGQPRHWPAVMNSLIFTSDAGFLPPLLISDMLAFGTPSKCRRHSHARQGRHDQAFTPITAVIVSRQSSLPAELYCALMRRKPISVGRLFFTLAPPLYYLATFTAHHDIWRPGRWLRECGAVTHLFSRDKIFIIEKFKYLLSYKLLLLAI